MREREKADEISIDDRPSQMHGRWVAGDRSITHLCQHERGLDYFESHIAARPHSDLIAIHREAFNDYWFAWVGRLDSEMPWLKLGAFF